MLAACNKPNEKMNNDLITRIAEIEVNDGYLEEYLTAAVAETRSHRTAGTGSYAANLQEILTSHIKHHT